MYVNQIDQIHRKIMELMWDNKYSDETDDGFFAIDEHLIKERYEEYKSVIRSPIENAQ